jgi:hypothetical protein
MPTRRRRRATGLATQAAELGLAVPEVVAYRFMRMALAGPNPSQADRQEFLRMSTEKVSAFYESWNAIFLAACRATLQSPAFWPAWSSVWLGPSWRRGTKLQRAALDIVASGIAPVHRRAVGNAKRLRKSNLGNARVP